MGDAACEECEGSGVNADRSIPEFDGMLACDEGTGVIDGHDDHDETAQGVDAGVTGSWRHYLIDYRALTQGMVVSIESTNVASVV